MFGCCCYRMGNGSSLTMVLVHLRFARWPLHKLCLSDISQNLWREYCWVSRQHNNEGIVIVPLAARSWLYLFCYVLIPMFALVVIVCSSTHSPSTDVPIKCLQEISLWVDLCVFKYKLVYCGTFKHNCKDHQWRHYQIYSFKQNCFIVVSNRTFHIYFLLKFDMNGLVIRTIFLLFLYIWWGFSQVEVAFFSSVHCRMIRSNLRYPRA